jgi:hypothetical protein
MTIDLTGGLRPEQDYMFGARPDDPEMRQGVSIWISSTAGSDGFGFPRLGLEAVASNWEQPGHSFQVACADGRVLLSGGSGPARRDKGPEGLSTVLGSGPFEMRCVEPFHKWSVDYAGPAIDTTVSDQVNGTVDPGKTVDVAVHVDAEMAVPPWIQGTMGEDAGRMLGEDTVEAAFMGGFRFEQLFRGRGSFRVGTGSEHAFTCTGLRIFRQGVRNVSGFWGHCWQSALFPSGRAFGYIAYPPREGGPPTYAEGYVFDGDGPLVPARLVDAPWMKEFVAQRGDVSCVLEGANSEVRIVGETFLSVIHRTIKGFPPLHQGIAAYTRDGEQTFGMIERSYPEDLMKW